MTDAERLDLTRSVGGAGPAWWRVRDRDKVKRCPVCQRPFRYWARLWQHARRQHGVPVAV